MGSRPSLCLAATAILLGCGDVRAVPPPLQDQGPPEDDLAANTPAADVDEGLSGAAVDGASEQGAEASPEPGSDSAGDNDDGAASGAATPEQTGTPDEGPDHGTGPGDWGPGDYPDDPFAQEYLEMSGVAGQPGTRGYKVHVPPGYEATRPTPLLFAFHGLLQNAVMFAVNGTALMEKSDAEGFILVMPTGVEKGALLGTWGTAGSWNGGDCCGNAQTAGVDDVALVRAILAEVGSHLNVDRSRVYATGLSNGAYLSHRLACEASDLFVAVAPVAGGLHLDPCAPSKPVAVLGIHGTGDAIVPYDEFPPSQDFWADANRCSTPSSTALQPQGGGDTRCETYAGCDGDVEVTSCTVEGGGHCWFGDPTCGTGEDTGLGIGNAVVGANSDTLDTTDAVWNFVSRFSRPPG